MARNDLNASSFAERINVGRSSISHILSGRNKPSLDFVINTVKEFPEVDLYWLLNGKGTYPKSLASVDTPVLKENPVIAPIESIDPIILEQELSTNSTPVQDLFSKPNQVIESNKEKINKGKNILKVILLYSDGTFEHFIP